MRTQVFVSYRRDGGLESAKYLHSVLKDTYEVFFDMESLRSGKFDENIEKAIRECTDFLLILSGNIFDRFEEEGDWISRELALALRLKKNIIPIFLPGFSAPETENENINTTMRYNGIKFAQDNEFLYRLVSFLKSNKKCVLPLRCVQAGYLLTDEAVNALKETCRNIADNKEYGVHVVLQFPNAVESAEKMTPLTYFGDLRKTAVEQISQRLIRRHQQKQRIVEVAIEYMIGDRLNLTAAPLQSALKNQELAQEVYLDRDGRKHTYYLVAAWVQIIEELLLEFTLQDWNRLTHYRNLPYNKERPIAIDCSVDRPAKGVNKYWYFTSHTRVEELPYDNQSVYPLMKPEVFTLQPQTLLKYILPDFYYKVADELCYSDSKMLKDILQDPSAEICFLGNYWYGLS